MNIDVERPAGKHAATQALVREQMEQAAAKGKAGGKGGRGSKTGGSVQAGKGGKGGAEVEDPLALSHAAKRRARKMTYDIQRRAAAGYGHGGTRV